MDIVFRNLPVILVFLTMAAYSWIFGGSRARELVPTIPWLWAFLMEALLFFPQRRPQEDAVSARRRAWKSLGRDPLLYLTILFLLILIIPFVNHGLCETCDYERIKAGMSPLPPMPFAPFCVNMSEHFGVVVWFVPTLTAMLAAKHALLRIGKRALLEMIVWNAAALAVLGFVQQMTGAQFPYWTTCTPPTYFFSVFGYPNMGGSFFVMAFAFSVGIWQHRVAEVAALPRLEKATAMRQQLLMRWLHAHYPLAAVVLNFFGAMCTLCRAALIMLFSLSVLAFLYYVVSLLFSRHERVRRVKHAAFAVGGLLVFLFAVSVFAPPSLGQELRSLSTPGILSRGKDDYHNRVAISILRDHPFFGVGGWGYRHFGRTYFDRMTLDLLLPCSKVTGVDRDEHGKAIALVVTTPEGQVAKVKAVAVDESSYAVLPRGELAVKSEEEKEPLNQRPLIDLLRVGTEGGGLFQPNLNNSKRKFGDTQRGIVRMRLKDGQHDGQPFDKEVALRFVKCADVGIEEVLDEDKQLSGFKVIMRDGRRADVAGVLVEREMLSFQERGGANVHNDYLQFLCEHGAVGMGLLTLIFFCLVVPIFRDWVKLYRAARFMKADIAPPWPRALYCMPAGAFWILMGNLALLIHALGDCPMRSAAVLSTFFVSLACAEGFIPRDIGGRR